MAAYRADKPARPRGEAVPERSDIRWFKTQFAAQVAVALTGTPFSIDFITALACQETGLVWSVLRRRPELSTAEILALCVGDTVARGRRAFPQSKAALLAHPGGAALFALARAALVALASYLPAYQKVAQQPAKFCHGFGIFQRDLQHFALDPGYFLEHRYADFDLALASALAVLQAALRRLGWQRKTRLSDDEQAAVAIVYNSGRYVPRLGLRQGWFDGQHYYGELIFDFLRRARTLGDPTNPPSLAPPRSGNAALPAASPAAATGRHYRVAQITAWLNLRREPRIDDAHPRHNVLARLPAGQWVQALSTVPRNGFLEIEVLLAGARYHGFAARHFLRPAPAPAELETAAPLAGVPAAQLPAPADGGTSRGALAGPFSLNEPGQPGRVGDTPARLRDSLAASVAWLAVDKPAHARYVPRAGASFAAVYAHDYCHLAGVYLPRVWWTADALASLKSGEMLAPSAGLTVAEVSVNDLFCWLREFGPRFGWRRTSTLDKLQREVNQGAVGLLIAHREEAGRDGQMVVIVPESATQGARRDATGVVTGPLESGAGRVNYRARVAPRAWWTRPTFTEWAYWLHA